MNCIKYVAKSFKNSDTVKLLELLDNKVFDHKKINPLIKSTLDYIDARYDCSDFRVAVLIRIIYLYGNKIEKGIKKLIINTLSVYPYLDCGSSSLCSWSENHRLTVNSSAYLFGQLFKSKKEINYNKNLYEHFKREIKITGERILKYGIKEFSSNTYYPVDLSAIGNIIEFSEDEEIKNLYRCVLDYFVFDILANSNTRLDYAIANARSYIDNKTNTNNHMYLIISSLMGNKITKYQEDDSCFLSFMNHHQYEVPNVFKKIHCLKEREITLSNSLEIEELIKQGLTSYSEENMRYLMEQGLFSNENVIINTIRYIKEKKMENNPLFKYLEEFINIPENKLLRYKKKHPIWGDNSYIGKGNTVSYFRNNYSLSCLEKYHIDIGSSQQSTNIVNVDGLTIFSLCPYKNRVINGGRNYWLGSLKNAHWSMDKNILLGIYQLKEKHQTHLYCPIEMFDEINLSYLKEGYIFARYHKNNVMIKSNSLKLVNSKNDNAIKVKGKMDNFKLTKYDFINKKLSNHYYIYVVDDTLPFNDFIKNNIKENVLFNGQELCFKNYILKYGIGLFKNKKEIIRDYQLYKSDYSFKKGNIVTFKLDKFSLQINLKNYQRKINN